MSEQLLTEKACRIPVASITTADSPRISGEVPEHSRLLAEADKRMPPIIVHRKRMYVIDGVHRLRAAVLRGDDTIEAVFFDGTDEDAFLLAVRSNIEHGLPLTRADREAAVTRILSSHPQYSDRALSSIVGLAPATVAAIRRRSGVEVTPSPSRIGRDGRVRPLDTADARLAASRMLAERPDTSLREVARRAQLSPATVRDVRERMRRGVDPVPQRPVRAARGKQDGRCNLGDEPRRSGEAPSARIRATLLQNLNRDPSLRFTESGRMVLRWLLAHAKGPSRGEKVAAAIPPHARYLVANLARTCAEEWLEFADWLERQLSEMA